MKLKTLYIRITNWEYWPTKIVYAPIFIYYLWLVVKARDFFFFSKVNPTIEMGGLYGASKFTQLNYLNQELKPKTYYVSFDTTLAIIQQINNTGIHFPYILKPDKAERGIGVKLVKNEQDLNHYLSKNKTELVLQEYIDYTFEAGVFYYRYPNEPTGVILSIVIKEFLTIVGDGISTVDTLIKKSDRALLVYDKLVLQLKEKIHDVPAKNELRVLEPIGNHNRGTKFINGNQYISENLQKIFDRIASQIPQFYYGRFDLRAPDLTSFLKGENIKIVEVNGANAEPAHIYDPSTPFIEGLKTLLACWKIQYIISQQNSDKGIAATRLKDAYKYYKIWKNAINP